MIVVWERFERSKGDFIELPAWTGLPAWTTHRHEATSDEDAFLYSFNAACGRPSTPSSTERERNRDAVEVERLISVELPLIMVFHSFQVVGHLAGWKGPDTRGQRDLIIWNVHEWELS